MDGVVTHKEAAAKGDVDISRFREGEVHVGGKRWELEVRSVLRGPKGGAHGRSASISRGNRHYHGWKCPPNGGRDVLSETGNGLKGEIRTETAHPTNVIRHHPFPIAAPYVYGPSGMLSSRGKTLVSKWKGQILNRESSGCGGAVQAGISSMYCM